MDLKDIQELIKFVAKSGATEVDLEIDNIKISIKSPPKKRRGEVDEPVTIIQQSPTPTNIPTQAPVPAPITITENKPDPVIEKTKDEDDNSNYITITASMIGTFYRSSSPENPPLINVGDSIKEGDTLCIIEAMKLFNEIESEVSGKIVKVLVDDATPIEFDQPLFLVDPS
tara:strand:- start:2272 stop:2784 length:513 start_codon:yes stop_codon:yes gene_type:complete